MRLKGKVAAITGGASGIGRATAIKFVAEGAAVAILDFDKERGLQTEALLKTNGGEAIFFHCDVTEPEEVKKAFENVFEKFGRLHILHNNAGGSTIRDNRVSDAPDEEFWAKMKLDLFGTWLGSKYGIPYIIQSGGGSVINMTSIFALIGTHKKDAYTAAKGAISALTRSMAVEYSQDKVRVNAVAPGATATERVKRLIAEDGVTALSANGQLLGLIEPEDIADAVLYLASDESKKVTGHILTVDAGLTIS
jgi:NAD(P)-dependent dehydrogenase (short-subunit alcohol dehydrogenase family)